eukprot:TRINITY_DN5046_c0_g2_i9.p1 TRINITY_DN5046_c0_g2~~TRINITY_DN5046_c0_g2_i9.p1  ORF type:complete len:127 (+),score=11.57 TRINITY_DN5046_c0_g2_i9:207-587(+)
MSWPAENDLQRLLQEIEQNKPPVTTTRVCAVVRIAVKNAKLYYKHVVHQIESFIKRTDKQHFLSCIYLIDAILKKSTKGKLDVYKKRFGIAIDKTLRRCFRCPDSDRVWFITVVKIALVIIFTGKY